VGPTGPTTRPAGQPPPLALYKQPPPTQFFAHTPAQKTSPLSLCSAASRERKLRKRVEKKSKGSQALNFSLTPLKALDTLGESLDALALEPAPSGR
jgi:hypothetical protein